MTTTVQLVGVPTSESKGTAIHVHHDKRSYLFGRVFEGTQRVFNSRKIHFQKLEHAFLSGTMGWDQMGGLFGFLLATATAVESSKLAISEAQKLPKSPKLPTFGIHGGDNLLHTLAAGRQTVIRKDFKLCPFEQTADPRRDNPGNSDPDWEDDALRVWKVPVRRSSLSVSRKRRRQSQDGDGEDTNNGEIGAQSERPVPDNSYVRLLVEKVMFGGGNVGRYLTEKELKDMKPSDQALVEQDGRLVVYQVPREFDKDAASIPRGKGWVLQHGVDSRKGFDYWTRNVLDRRLPPTTHSDCSMTYIVKPHDRRGKINASLAKALGVQGQDFRPLAEGRAVTLANGTVVKPEMVMGDKIPGKGFIVADIESRDFLDNFMARPEWDDRPLMRNIHVIYWVLGPGMAQQPRIQDFVKARPSIKHIFCSRDTCPDMIIHPRGADFQIKLRAVDPDRFSVPYHDNTINYPAPPADSSLVLGRSGMGMQLMPRLVPFENSVVPFPNLLEAVEGIHPDVLALAKEARETISSPDFQQNVDIQEQGIPNRDAEVIALGTGSSCPSVHRNVSATMVRVPGVGTYLFDCGEGTLGQIYRCFGPVEAVKVLRELRGIVISHLHADHHLGTVSVLKAWYQQTLRDKSDARLVISCITEFQCMMAEISEIEDIGFHRLHFPNCKVVGDPEEPVVWGDDLKEFGLTSIKRIFVSHCRKAHASEITLTSGLRIAYSGDCRPSTTFAKECRGAHLLIHESTFGSDKGADAIEKKHSTLWEAISVAAEMRARRTLLTHFSQRYVKSDSLKITTEQFPKDGNHLALLAFDMMRVKLGEFQHAAAFVPAIEKLTETMSE